MSQEPSANRDRGVGASSRWDKILDGLFVVLNTALSGPPGWQRAAQSPTPPEKRWKRADFWLSALLCILLTALNAAWLFLTFVVYPYPDPGLNFGWFSSENPMLLYLQLLPILFVLFFLVGILRGRLTGTARSTRRIGVAVCLINTASLFVLPIALGLIIGGEAGLEMFAFLAGGVFLITGFAQGLAGIGGGILGGLLGSRSRLGATFWWGINLGLLLTILNAAFLLLAFVAFPKLWFGFNLSWLSSTGLNPLALLNLFLCSVAFFLVGIWRGRVTGNAGAAVRLSLLACLIGGFALHTLAIAFSLNMPDEVQANLQNFAFDMGVWLLFLAQGLASVGGGSLGGLLGSRFLRPRPVSISLLRNKRAFTLVLACLVIILVLSGGVLGVLSIAGKGPLASLGTPITEYTVPTAQSAPGAIITGPDGNLWFTENDIVYGNKIGRITPKGIITEFPIPTPNSTPSDITVGPDGNLWFTESTRNRIGRITPGGSIVEFLLPPLPIGSGPGSITLGPDGNLWFTEAGNQIGRITPQGAITEFAIPVPYGSPRGITAGPDGNLWFTESVIAGGHQIGRITPTGKLTLFPLPPTSRYPQYITAGPDGNLWFTEDTNQIGRITPTGAVTEFPGPTFEGGVGGIIAGPDGNLWFTDEIKLGCITIQGSVTEFPMPASINLGSITIGPQHILWFTEPINNRIGWMTLPRN